MLTFILMMLNLHQITLFKTTDVHTPYRIPAIATAYNGDVIALGDYRPCGYDIGWGEVDIHCRISKDNGLSWSTETKIADGTGAKNTFGCGFGDAAIVADNESNRVLVMCVAGNTIFGQGTETKHNHMAKIYGEYNHLENKWEWSEPIDVTQIFFKDLFPNAYTMFIASGKILQGRRKIKQWDKYNRIYCVLVIKDDYTPDYKNYVIYSDDFGVTWKILGECACFGGDEAKVEELPNGQIVLTSRKRGGGRYINVFTYSDFESGIGKWDEQAFCQFEGKNATNGELLMYKTYLLQSLPIGDDRSKVTLYYKKIDNNIMYNSEMLIENWVKYKVIDDGASAYSTMTILPNGKLGFFYEKNDDFIELIFKIIRLNL